MRRSAYCFACWLGLVLVAFTTGCGSSKENTAVKQDQLNEYLQQNPQPSEGANLSE